MTSRERTLAMIATCMQRQVASEAYPSLGISRPDPDPVNHETLTSVADPGVEGHATNMAGSEDAQVPPRPEYVG